VKSCWIKGIVGVLVLIALGVFFVRHSGWFLWSHQPLQYMPNMHHTPALKPQRGYAFFSDFSSSRVPPEGSLAREQIVYKYKGAQFLAQDVEKFRNPLPISKATVLRGKFLYENNCLVCHGVDGNGNGPVVPKFPNPPSLMADKIRDYQDSQIYHVITNGQNTMGSYAPQIVEKDRWAVVHYVRVLQLANRPSDEDLKVFDSIVKEKAQ